MSSAEHLVDLLKRAGRDAIAVTMWKTAQGWQVNISKDKKSWRVGVQDDIRWALEDALEQHVGKIPEPVAPAPKPRSVFD